MPAELLLQRDMFTGELVDNRTASQRRRDAHVDLPTQMEMFPQRELAQYVPRPMMPLSAETRLVLIQEDPRTEDEIERDRELEARSLTHPMFDEKEKAAADDETVESTPTDPDLNRVAARAELERAVKDIVQTIAAAPEVLAAQAMWLALATVEAHAAGVSKAEVTAILQQLDGTRPPCVLSGQVSKRSAMNSLHETIVFDATLMEAHLPMMAL